MKTIIYLIRHTRTIGNEEHRLTGRSDYEVIKQGQEYIYKLTKRLKNIKFDKAYSSTSERTKKTIQPLADLNKLEIVQDENLCEMYFGIYEGMTWDEVNRINPEIDRLHKLTNEIMEIPEQESTKEVEERMYNFIVKIAKENLGKIVLICSHGIAIEAFLRRITGVPFKEQIEEYSQKNTSINILEYEEDKGFKVLTINDKEHLNY